MSTKDSNRCLFIGLPSSGKSSFIGALWHVAESGEISSSYSITVQPEDREYLNRLRTSFLDCKPVERTKTDFVKRIELDIKENGTGKIAKFLFPDLSGETYESQFEDRKLTQEYIEQVVDCNSIMLFVNPDFIKKGHLISDAENMFDYEDLDDSNGSKDNPQAESNEVKWTPRLCQSQVVLVDLLQMIAKNLQVPCKINIMISAWDIIKNLPEPNEANIKPEDWFTQQLPLLFQYLTSNAGKFSFSVFGISAQGGHYSEKDEENINLQEKIKQSERIIVQSGETTTHDITVPLKWLFE